MSRSSSAEIDDKLGGVLIRPEGHPGQLQSGRPSFRSATRVATQSGSSHRPAMRSSMTAESSVFRARSDWRISIISWATRRRLHTRGRSVRVERTRWMLEGIRSGQLPDVGHKVGVRQTVEIVEDDQEFGQVGHQ